MADDKSKRGARDRSTVSATETYELADFAKKHDISIDKTRELIDRVGNTRVALEAAVANGVKTNSARKSRSTTTTATTRKSSDKAPAKAAVRASPPRASVGREVIEKAASATVPIATALEAAAEVVVEPVAKTLKPMTKRAAGVSRKLTTAAKRSTSSSRKAAVTAPTALRNRATAALETAKAAVNARTASVVGAAAAGLVTGLAVNLGRKVVVQAPTALAGDWLEGLKVEHKLALALFDQIQGTDNGDTGQRSVFLTQLKHALGKHAFTEENVIYPALRKWGDTADADKLNHDHGHVKQYLYDLEEMDNGTPAFLEKIAAFRADLEAHIREEEEAIFPPLHAALGETGNAKVTAQANKEGFKLA